MANKILITICVAALNIWAFAGVVCYGDFIDIVYYPIVILLLACLFYRYCSKYPVLFIFFNFLIVIKYFDSLNKVEGYPDKSMEKYGYSTSKHGKLLHKYKSFFL